MNGFVYRILMMIINICFPPLAVGLLTGLKEDFIFNCCLLILAVIPSHVHGFYVSCIYFHRRRKVRKGRYPGGPKPLIFSENVINGGASNAEVDRLYRKERGLGRQGSRRVGKSRDEYSAKQEMDQYGGADGQAQYTGGNQLGGQRGSRRRE